jgi:hypothetical protein
VSEPAQRTFLACVLYSCFGMLRVLTYSKPLPSCSPMQNESFDNVLMSAIAKHFRRRIILLEFSHKAHVDRKRFIMDPSAEWFPRQHGLRVGVGVIQESDILEQNILTKTRNQVSQKRYSSAIHCVIVFIKQMSCSVLSPSRKRLSAWGTL